MGSLALVGLWFACWLGGSALVASIICDAFNVLPTASLPVFMATTVIALFLATRIWRAR